MLSAKQIEEISKQISRGDTPDAVIALLNAYMEKETQPSPVDTNRSDILWSFFKDSPKAVLRLNAEHRVMDVNDAFTTLCKASRAEILGRKVHSVLNLQEELQLSEIPANISGDSSYAEFTITCEREDRKRFTLRIERFPDSVCNETYLLVTDISEHRRFAETLAQDSVRGEIFVDIVNSLWQDFMNYEKTLDVLTNKVSQHIGGSCIIHLLMDETDIVEHVAINHSNPKATALFQDLLYSTRWHAASGLPQEVVSAGNAVLIPNVTKENLAMLGNQLFADCISALQTRSLLVMPMYHSERIIGTITLLRSGTDMPYTNKDKSFIQRIANVGAMAIINAQRMRKFNSELLAKLRSARNEVRHIHVMEAFSQALTIVLDEESGVRRFDTVLELFGHALEAESAFIATEGRASGTFSIIAAWSSGDFPPALQARFEGDIFLPRLWTMPLESGVILHRTLDNFTDQEKKFLADVDLVSIAIVPIVQSGRLRAVIAFENCKSEDDCLDRNERTMKTFAALAAPALLQSQSDKGTFPDAQE